MKNSKLDKLIILLVFLVFQCVQLIGQTNYKSLNYLYRISGFKTVSGIHNREPNLIPSLWTDSITIKIGKTPGLWSGDFLFLKEDIESRWKMIYQAEKAWNKGSLINMMWHTCSPKFPEPCAWDDKGVLDDLTDTEWTSLITDGGDLNINWKKRLDEIAVYLQYLKEKGIEVFFRPFHEMNQPVFWWAGRKGSEGTARLYRITHDYLKYSKGLTNLIWIWDIQDFKTLESDLNDYNPGNEYWDILAMDMYSSDGSGYTAAKYNACLKAAGGKPIAIGECQLLPTSEELTEQPRWTFFMSWSELTVKYNTIPQIKELYGASNVITLDKMPGWEGISKK